MVLFEVVLLVVLFVIERVLIYILFFLVYIKVFYFLKFFVCRKIMVIKGILFFRVDFLGVNIIFDFFKMLIIY